MARAAKREARVAYLACSGDCCCAVVLRGAELIDWAGCANRDRIATLLCSSSISGETRLVARCGDAPLPDCFSEINDDSGCSLARGLVERILRLGGGCREGSG